jgi:hypothetical protein
VKIGDVVRAHQDEVGIVHQLSQNGRPYCGAEPLQFAAERASPQPITCAACRRLAENDVRSAAHAARPRADESED